MGSRHWTLRDEEVNVLHQRFLGEGGYGEVHQVSLRFYDYPDILKMIENSSGRCFARKVIPLRRGADAKDIENEMRAVNKLCKSGHANIVQVVEFGSLKLDSVWHFIDMELCDFTLANYADGEDVPLLPNWKKVKENDFFHSSICNINRQIIEGLVFIHHHREV